ncbi:hypothetical protein DEU56DRAFT_911336 [Suillus clintonianus]|uniref:uncharacterized protein n=1 Tax=Suillus clintonianus TaxID=1904413 RepID=UPI001B861427|nr:uncharacterized protein DEU56DRAFT_911336 [Suillus clintonianus]KAG2141231.1 hypothetical protein DEU56DRAFT_911336 [Suillus clintonianus]
MSTPVDNSLTDLKAFTAQIMPIISATWQIPPSPRHSALGKQVGTLVSHVAKEYGSGDGPIPGLVISVIYHLRNVAKLYLNPIPTPRQDNSASQSPPDIPLSRICPVSHIRRTSYSSVLLLHTSDLLFVGRPIRRMSYSSDPTHVVRSSTPPLLHSSCIRRTSYTSDPLGST